MIRSEVHTSHSLYDLSETSHSLYDLSETSHNLYDLSETRLFFLLVNKKIKLTGYHNVLFYLPIEISSTWEFLKLKNRKCKLSKKENYGVTPLYMV